MNVFSIVFGALISIGLIVFSIRQIISIVKSVRNRREKGKIEKKEG